MTDEQPGKLIDVGASELTGPLIAAATSAAFDDVVARAVATDPVLVAKHPVAKLRPPLARVPDLLDQAAEVLRGNPIAARRFREMLGSFGGSAIPTTSALHVLEAHPDGTCACVEAKPSRAARKTKEGVTTEAPASNESQRFVTLSRLEPVLAAAVYASRDAGELATLVGGIQLGLAGSNELNTLFHLALTERGGPAVRSAFDTAAKVLGFPSFPPIAGFPPDEGGWMGPGFGPGPGFRPPPGAPWFTWPPPFPGGGRRPGVLPPVPKLDPSLTDQFEECMLFEVIPELHRRGIGFPELVFGTPGNYVITSVEPDNACPWAMITIRGRNFSGVTAVLFVDNRGRTVSAAPSQATATRIDVRLPPAAASGPVWLNIPVTATLCRTELVLARPGTPGAIRVGSPSVVAFGVEGDRRCVTTGTPAGLYWSVEPPEARVRLIKVMDGTNITLGENLEAVGRIDVLTLEAGVLQFQIEVVNPSSSCSPVQATTTLEVREPTPLIEILAVEITQAIQIFDLADLAAPTNNSVGLIADMDTVLRVFVRSVDVAVRITGSLELRGVSHRPINRLGPFIWAQTDPIRAETDHSLNFLIPAADASGSAVPARITVVTYGAYCGDVVEEHALTLTWADLPPLPVTVRRIAESDGSVIPERDALNLIRNAFRKMPSPMTSIVVRPGVFQIEADTTEDNYCHDGGYYQLALSVAYEHNATEGYATDPHESSWVGIYTQTGCTTASGSINGMMAWPWTSTCISQANETTAAHELMHTLSRRPSFECLLGHTVTGIERCEDVFQPVACHRLERHPGGELIDVPFDIRNNTAVATAWDLQSYRGGNGRWLSPELWVLGRLLMNTRY